MKHRNTSYVVQNSYSYYKSAIQNNLMQVTIKGRNNKTVIMPNGMNVVEFINCSYLGLDLHPKVIEASKSVFDMWGINFCCARSRFSIEPTRILEEELSALFRGRAITFPSVTTTHMSVMPLLASGVLIDPKNPPKVRMIFDKFAHSSMQYLKPILANEANVVTIRHNSLEELRTQVLDAHIKGEVPVYIADGVYSMGGLCPLKDLLKLSQELNFYIYIDDAHGTSIYGEYGEGYVMDQIEGNLPDNLIITFCLSKGFGCNGGGVLLPNKMQEELIRSYGQIYSFSAALDFSIVAACLAATELHKDGTVRHLQQVLHNRVAYYDKITEQKLNFSPIRMVPVGREQDAIEIGRRVLEDGFFVSVVFFPIVSKNQAQLRICIAANHTESQIADLARTIQKHTNIVKSRGICLV